MSRISLNFLRSTSSTEESDPEPLPDESSPSSITFRSFLLLIESLDELDFFLAGGAGDWVLVVFSASTLFILASTILVAAKSSAS